MATPQTKTAARSQEFVPIREIRDGIVVLEDGSLHTILMASSLNFALKSADEQDAIIAQYQNFLNSLDFSVQFFIQSRKLNIAPYLDTLRESAKNQTNELLKIQTTEYIEFIKNFVQSANIVSKTFFIVISYTPTVFESKGGVLSGIVDMFLPKRKEAAPLPTEKFEEYALQLRQRAGVAGQGLARTGVRIIPLQTDEVVELFFGLFNPEELERGKAAGAPK